MSSPVRLNHMSHTNRNEMGIWTQPPNIKHPKPNDWSELPHTVAIPLTLKHVVFKPIIGLLKPNFIFFILKTLPRAECLISLKCDFYTSWKKTIELLSWDQSSAPNLSRVSLVSFNLFVKFLKLVIFEGLLTKSLPLFDARVSIESSQFGEMTSDDSLIINDSFWLSFHIFSCHFRIFRILESG